ncbi:MAG: hypothetical protein AAFU79_31215 [Myxococcota bacterium]
MRRIETRPYRVGAGDTTDPEHLDELQVRREKHERMTRGKPERTFAAVLRDRMRGGSDEEEPPTPEASPGAIEPHLGLDPRQNPSLANGQGRAAKVILKG